MHPLPLGLALALALAACQTGSHVVAPEYELTDLSGEYVTFWDRTQGMAQSPRVEAFKAQFGAHDFYDPHRFADVDRARVDERIAQSIEQFAPIRDRYLRKAAAFNHGIRPALTTFRQTFPDITVTTPVYLLHSLGEMDGGTRTLDGRIVLIFGADVMARVHDFDDEQPFIHHELFHIYHQHFLAECPQVWCSLWIEGLAVYASQQLNPDATDSQLLLTLPEPIRAQVDAHLDGAVCEVKLKLDSSDAKDTNALFSSERLNCDIPARAGYYIGYLLAREAGKTRTLQQLARMAKEEVRPLLDTTIAQLVDCP